MHKNLISSLILVMTLATFSLPGLADDDLVDDQNAITDASADGSEETGVPGE